MAAIGARGVLAAVAAVSAVALALTGCTPESGSDSDVQGVLPAEALAPLVDALPEQSSAISTIPRPAGTAAPTNRWYSGVAFGDGKQPVFPMPMSFQMTGDGFAFGVPDVAATATGVAAPAVADMTVSTGTDSTELVRWDDVSVTLALVSDGRPQGEVTIARGSPVVGYRVLEDSVLRLSAPVTADGDAWVADVAGQRFVMLAPDGAVADDGVTVSVGTGDTISWAPLPDGADVASIAEAAVPVTGVSTGYAVDGETSTTRLRYRTASDAATLIAVTPQQAAGREDSGDLRCGLGTFTTMLGVLELCAGSSLSWETARVEPAGAFELDGLGDSELAELRDAVTADLAATTFATDTYFGGKSLARAADLLVLAEQLGADSDASVLRERLAGELRTWTEPGGCEKRGERCFVFDRETGGVVGRVTSFGSEGFNDHHFHYGYFLYAAALVAADDSALRDELAPVMTLLAADLASGEASGMFPVRRTFDPYSGHSWASGASPFADGNNQESSSEAVAAWNGLALWASVAGDEALEREAIWMLSSEAASAQALWLGFDASAPPYREYGHDAVGIVWDGKLDYATWFSPEPAAILGIQLIPMNAASGYLGGDPDRIRANVAEALAGGAAPQFADAILMYSALAGPEDAAAALEAARELPDGAIDDGSSRSHLLAFLMSRPVANSP